MYFSQIVNIDYIYPVVATKPIKDIYIIFLELGPAICI